MQNLWNQILNSYSVNGTALKTVLYYNTFRKTYKFLKKSQWWSQEQVEAYQLQQLRRLLCHAYDYVPYYTKLFDKLGLKSENIQSLKDLQKLPFLTKEIIKKHITDLKATNYPESKFELSRTGGSTGQPLRFYIEKGIWLSRLMAYAKIQMDWTGCSFFDRSVFITGRDEPWKYQLFGRILVLSSFNMDDKHLPQFIQKIQKLKPKYVMGYPSAITNLANYIKKNNLGVFPSVKAIICQSETLYEWQRDLLEETFQCPVHDQYGLREQAVLGVTCDHSKYYHMFPEYGIVELIGKDGKPVMKEGEIGEIVGTGFHTYLFPFIRYKTGDLGTYTAQKCQCGRNYPLLKKIEGRLQEFVVSKTKRLVPITGVYGLVAKCSQNVKECQFYQDTEGELVLNVVKTQNYTDGDYRAILKNFQKFLGNEFNLTIHYVKYIPRTTRGKYQFLIQKLPIEFAP
jgi:phenylacetate-CoA ligase